MNRTDILKLTNEVFDRLEGDWLLVGGALLHVLGLSDRRTLDIDLVPMQKVSNEDQLKVIEVAVKNGFPPETINFAAEYFVKKQKFWKDELVLLRTANKARIFRPSKKLFRALKEARGTETDKLDIEIFERGVKD